MVHCTYGFCALECVFIALKNVLMTRVVRLSQHTRVQRNKCDLLAYVHGNVSSESDFV